MRKRGTIRVLFATVFVVLLAALVAGGASAGDGDHHKSGDAAKQATDTQATAPTTAGVVAGATVTTVASGLDNPRDLAFGPDGRLYVAEAGHGGPFCAPGGHEGGGDTCAGFTSRISWIDQGTGTVNPVVDGIISLADSHGFGATGVDGVSVTPGGWIYGIVTGSASGVPEGFPAPEWALAKAKSQLGRLIRVSGPGAFSSVADVGGFDFAWAALHKDLVPGQFPDANPYGVLALPRETWVVDAGSNTLDRVRPDGSVDIVAFFPNPPSSDAVPTCVNRGPDGALYIGELTGGGNVPGASTVWRWTAGSGLHEWATGLTAVTGCGFGADGQFYAVEFSTLGLDNAAPGTGALVRVPPGSTSPTTIVSELNFPGGFAGGADGSLYFSDWSIAPAVTGLGAVKRVQLH
jgi:hypothetical protein